MFKRKIDNIIENWFKSSKKALLIDGARQVGKTTSIKKFLKQLVEKGEAICASFNLLESRDVLKAINTSGNAQDLLLRLSSFSKHSFVSGKTLIFIDEIQEATDAFTIIKYLIEDGNYRFIFSGSLLGVKMQNIQSFPVAFVQVEQMYPLDFEEFLWASGSSKSTIQYLYDCFLHKRAVDEVIHDKTIALFNLYLMIGGMPEAVYEYVQTNNLKTVLDIQRNIDVGYIKDVSKYGGKDAFLIGDIYDLIPSELNCQNKRFILKELNQKARFYKYETSFVWLKNSGIGLFVYNANNPKYPLLASKERTLFKLFPSDVGILSYKLLRGNQIKILNGDVNINYGSFYESVVAQELNSHGFKLFYHNNKKYGEIDFLIEGGDGVIPLEVKSGKDYKRHSALTALLENREFGIKYGIVLSNANLSIENNKWYLPIYMIMFIQDVQSNTDIQFPHISAI